MQRTNYLGSMLAALGTLEGNIARLVVYGGFTDPLAPLLAEINREAKAAAAEMQRLESLDEAAQDSDTESAWYEARGRHEALNRVLGLLTGYTKIEKRPPRPRSWSASATPMARPASWPPLQML